MSLADSHGVSLNYGRTRQFTCEVEPRRIIAAHTGPEPNPNLADDLAHAVAHPLDFPPLAQAVIPDDCVTLVLDRYTPHSATLVAAAWQVLEGRGVAPANVVILQPAAIADNHLADPRGELPEAVCAEVKWKVHDPTRRSNCAYLASTSSGERIYLAREVTDADVVISIGQTCYDPIIGFRGTNSVFYPGLSLSDALHRALGQGHIELGPDDDRPLRQMIDEIGWLLGTQFSIQVVPAAGGGAAHVVAGASDSVLRCCRELLADDWLIQLESRPDVVVAAVEADAQGHGWDQVGAALATSRNLVARDGKIVLLSELDADLGPGLEIIRQSAKPREALKPLRKEAPPDLVPATQLAAAADWANVYMLSLVDSDILEDLFIIPVENEAEVSRLLRSNETCVFLGTAQHTFGQIL